MPVNVYQNIEIYLYSLCQEDYEPLRSSVFATASLVQPLADDQACGAIGVPVNGIAQTGFSNISASADVNENILVPPNGSDCINGWCEAI